MSEELVIRFCSPTLAGLKTGNLFSCRCGSGREMNDCVRELNRKLRPKGLRALPLRFRNGRALVYLYRPDRLRRDLCAKDAAALLSRFGYPRNQPERCLGVLMRKLRLEDAFPHEIGLFLGYPPEDVLGFIEKPGECKCVGCWKVYGDEAAALKTFEGYRRCTESYLCQYACGKKLENLAVAGSE